VKQSKNTKKAKPQLAYPLALKRAEEEIVRLQEFLSEVQRVSGSPIFDLTPEKHWQFTHYVRLLLEWNQRLDLISPKDEARIAERHLLESLAVLSVWRFIVGTSVLDLGSGGGFPGIPMKIMCPDLVMTLLESRQRKWLFLNSTKRYLGLENCYALCDRVENLAKSPERQFEVIISRAVADLRKLWRWSRPLLVSGGVLLAMKGGDLEEELKALKKFDPNACYRILKYPPEWKIDPSRCVVAVADNRQSLESYGGE
jgi:16S rRNA (guanine527-N7)-methyltransferase